MIDLVSVCCCLKLAAQIDIDVINFAAVLRSASVYCSVILSQYTLYSIQTMMYCWIILLVSFLI